MGLRAYHAGQIEVQAEANSRHVAQKLAEWTGPVVRYAESTDLLLLAHPSGGTLRFAALSGRPPLATVAGPGTLRLHPASAEVMHISTPVAVGGLVISLARAERARLNGELAPSGAGRSGLELELAVDEAFTLCRKYMAPSAIALEEDAVLAGPVSSEEVGLLDGWAADLIASARTAFLATADPGGRPDVAHRGGPAGFLELDRATGVVSWVEWVGDGVFKSAGNVRATGVATLLVNDFESGDALELTGTARYETLLFDRRPRRDPLLQLPDPFPVQGRMTLAASEARRLRAFSLPRRPIAGEQVTSRSTVDDQVPV